jgi:hypothetical protein
MAGGHRSNTRTDSDGKLTTRACARPSPGAIPPTGGLGSRGAPCGAIESPLRPPPHTTDRRSA